MSEKDLNEKDNGNEKKKSTVTKKQLIHAISQEKGIHPNDVRHVIQAFLDKIIDCLAEGDRLEFRDFGIFEVVQRKQKIGRNPKKASVPIVIPPRRAVRFASGKKMRKAIENDLDGDYDDSFDDGIDEDLEESLLENLEV